jgi:hypothetical protein
MTEKNEQHAAAAAARWLRTGHRSQEFRRCVTLVRPSVTIPVSSGWKYRT